MNNANSASQAGAVTLSPKTPLTVANANSASLEDNVTLGGGGTALVVANMASADVVQGFQTGPNLAPGGGLFNDATGWTVGTGWAIQNGRAEATNISTTDVLEATSFSLPNTGVYDVIFDWTFVGGSVDDAFIVNLAGQSQTSVSEATGSKIFTFNITGSLSGFSITGNSNGQLDGQVDNLIIRDKNALVLGLSLTVQGANSASIADNVVLTGINYILSVAAAMSASLMDSPTITPRHQLTVNGANSASQTSSPTLEPKTTLVMADAASLTQTTSPVLTAAYVLTVQNAVSATDLQGNLALNGSLGVETPVSLTQADNVVLTTAHALIVQDAVSAGILENIVLAPKVVLTVQNMNSETLLDEGTVTNLTYQITVQAATSLSQTDNVALFHQTTIEPGDAYSVTTADNIDLLAHYFLTVSDAVSLTELDAVTIGIPIPTPDTRRVFLTRLSNVAIVTRKDNQVFVTKEDNSVAVSKIQNGEIVYFTSSGVNAREVFFVKDEDADG